MVASMPVTIRSAASSQPRWRSIITPDRITEPGIDHVLVGVLRRGAVGGLEDRVAVTSLMFAPGAIRCRRPARRTHRTDSRH